jgi:hypothetical protein
LFLGILGVFRNFQEFKAIFRNFREFIGISGTKIKVRIKNDFQEFLGISGIFRIF